MEYVDRISDDPLENSPQVSPFVIVIDHERRAPVDHRQLLEQVVGV